MATINLFCSRDFSRILVSEKKFSKKIIFGNKALVPAYFKSVLSPN